MDLIIGISSNNLFYNLETIMDLIIGIGSNN